MAPREVKGYLLNDETTISKNTILILEAILNDAPTYQREIAKKTGLSDTTVNYIFRSLYRAGIITTVPAIEEKTGRLIRKIGITIEKAELQEIIRHFKNAVNEIQDGKKLLIKIQEKNAKKPKRKPFSVKR